MQPHARWNTLVDLDAADPERRGDSLDLAGQVFIVRQNADERAGSEDGNVALLSAGDGQELVLDNIAADGVDVRDRLRVALLSIVYKSMLQTIVQTRKGKAKVGVAPPVRSSVPGSSG